jgi:hypothetical protein
MQATDDAALCLLCDKEFDVVLIVPNGYSIARWDKNL